MFVYEFHTFPVYTLFSDFWSVAPFFPISSKAVASLLAARIFGRSSPLLQVRRFAPVLSASLLSRKSSNLGCPKLASSFSVSPFLIKRAMASESSANKLHDVVFVLGLPGSGKGTQCALINQTFGFIHLSAGDLLRAEMTKPDSPVGQLITTHMTNGTIVPVEITCKLLENAMLACGDAPGFLIDGFPRNQDNLDGWEREMSSKVKVHFVLNLVAPIDVCTKRCLSRAQNRPDDNEDTLKKRFITHNQITQPIVDHFREVGLLHQIDTAGTLQEVFELIKSVFVKAGFQELVRASS